MTWRSAGPGDRAVVLELAGEFHRGDGLVFEQIDEAVVDALLAGERGEILVAHVDGHPAGYAVLTYGYSVEHHGVDGLIDELFVRERYRRLGVGREGVRAAVARFREAGVRVVHLEVDDDNLPARALYARQGFVEDARRPMRYVVDGSRPTGPIRTPPDRE